MTVTAEILEAMLAAGCSPKQLIAVIRADEKIEEEKRAAKREADRIRQRNHRARHAMSRVTPVTPRDKRDKDDDNKPSPLSELRAVLDPKHAAAVIEHRNRLHKPLTAHAATLLASKLARWPTPNEAADAMIVNGWQGFEPAWMDRHVTGQRPEPPRERTILDVIDEKLKVMKEAEHVIETSYERGNPDVPAKALRSPAPTQR